MKDISKKASDRGTQTAATERDKALALAERAEAAMVEEYAIWRQSWERNPTLSALGLGVNAIRALREEIESDA